VQKNPAFDALIAICKYHFRTIEEPLLISELLGVQDWQHFIHLSSHHAVRPIAYDVLRQYQHLVPTDVLDYLRRFMFTQANHNKQVAAELERILLEMETKKIEVLPMGGALFMSQFYGIKQLRETEDIDLAVSIENLHFVLTHFIQEGYVFCDTKLNVGDFCTEALRIDKKGLCTSARLQKNEVLLILSTKGCSAGVQNGFDIQAALEQMGRMKVANRECLLPTPETQLLMMAAQHGTKESWLKLKHLCDLMAFHQQYGKNLYWTSVFKTAHAQKNQQALGVGLELLRLHFGIRLHKNIMLRKPSVCNQILTIWRDGAKKVAWTSTLKYEKVKQHLADDTTNSNAYLRQAFLSLGNLNTNMFGMVLRRAFLLIFLKNF
jgi:hypothetical protein